MLLILMYWAAKLGTWSALFAKQSAHAGTTPAERAVALARSLTSASSDALLSYQRDLDQLLMSVVGVPTIGCAS